jgi:FAD/FMN-containing dehydrogenase
MLRPDDGGYDAARRVWNGLIDRYPTVIVRCATVSDVICAIGLARKERLTVAVRSGGHSAAGHGVCERGLVIDLSQMKGVRVNPDTHSARAEPGATTGEFLSAIQKYGRATPTCPQSRVGLAGLDHAHQATHSPTQFGGASNAGALEFK